MSDRPILLTGSHGQVGAALARTLRALGRVEACGRDRMNLAEPESLRMVLRDLQPALIVNAAAYTAVDQAESEPGLADLVNHQAVRVMAEEAQRIGASVVHFSTDYVFDGDARTPYRPDAPTNPQSVYGRTKRDGEVALAEGGADHLILRTSWVYSTRGRNFLLTMLRLAQEREELRVVDDQLGSPTWADWLATATTEIVRRRLTASASHPFAGVSGIYHLTNSGETTWCGFARAIIARAKLPREPNVTGITTQEYPTPAQRPAYSVLDCTTTEETFGISRPNWEESLDEAMRTMEFSADD